MGGCRRRFPVERREEESSPARITQAKRRYFRKKKEGLEIPDKEGKVT